MELTPEDAADLKSFHDHRIETYKSMISISIEIFKYLALLNGGAVAGMVSALATLQKSIDIRALRFSLICFVVGLILNGGAVGAAYITQLTLFGDSVKPHRFPLHTRYLKVSLASAALSLGSFCVGAITAVLGVRT